MAINQPLVSNNFPYLPLRLDVGQHSLDLEALLDTGFDGDGAMPSSVLAAEGAPAGYVDCRLADGSVVSAPVLRGPSMSARLARSAFTSSSSVMSRSWDAVSAIACGSPWIMGSKYS